MVFVNLFLEIHSLDALHSFSALLFFPVPIMKKTNPWKTRKLLFYVLEIFVRMYLKEGLYSKKCLKSIYLA